MSQKGSPHTTFNNIFVWADSFCIEFCTFIGNLYPHMSANFGLFILAFNEMALILLRTPIIFLQANQFVDMFNILIGDAVAGLPLPG